MLTGDTMKLTKSNEDYLEAIYQIYLTHEKIKSVEISKMLNVSKPGVTKALKVLIEHNLIHKESYGNIYLTDEGKQKAQEIYFKHKTIKNFLLKIGVSPEIAESDCCKIEHVISNETLNKLLEYLKGSN